MAGNIYHTFCFICFCNHTIGAAMVCFKQKTVISPVYVLGQIIPAARYTQRPPFAETKWIISLSENTFDADYLLLCCMWEREIT